MKYLIYLLCFLSFVAFPVWVISEQAPNKKFIRGIEQELYAHNTLDVNYIFRGQDVMCNVDTLKSYLQGSVYSKFKITVFGFDNCNALYFAECFEKDIDKILIERSNSVYTVVER